MAQKVSVTYACDYDRNEIPQGQERTHVFGLDRREYEIDLCQKHSDELDDILKWHSAYARKATAKRGKRRRRTAAHRQRSAQIRAWAKSRGFRLSDRGRIPADVVNKYDTTHG